MGIYVSKWMILATGVMYLYVSIEQLVKGNSALSGIYAGYAFSNIFLYRLAL